MDERSASAQLQRTVTLTATDLPAALAVLEVPVVDADNYRIIREVARGGIGRILEAIDVRLQREVAIKELLNPAAGRSRFIREAILTARLQHPSIVPVHEVGVFQGRGPFIAMKLVRGESLREAIRKRPTFAARMELLSAVLAVAEAMAYAHGQRIIHRDLKPANILLGNFGEVVVVDWGLAKHLDVVAVQVDPIAPAALALQAEVTIEGTIVGTPAYMPPEQALGHRVDERADVYALGAIMYHVLTGEAPFQGGNAAEVLRGVLTDGPTPLLERAPETPGDLAAITTKAMSLDVASRYRDAGELAADLRRFQVGQLLSLPQQDKKHDPAIEAAFEEELRTRTVKALRTTCAIGVPLLVLFIIPARIHLGHFDAHDLLPRSVTILAFVLLFAASHSRAGRRWSQLLSTLSIFFVAMMVLVMNVLEGGVLENAASLTLIYLSSSTLLPLTPKRTSVLVGTLTVVAAATLLAYGVRPSEPRFVTLVLMLIASSLVASVGSRISHRTRRAEFYNGYRLQRANERLARLDYDSHRATSGPTPAA
jgi:serine/threonine protein kinase